MRNVNCAITAPSFGATETGSTTFTGSRLRFTLTPSLVASRSMIVRTHNAMDLKKDRRQF